MATQEQVINRDDEMNGDPSDRDSSKESLVKFWLDTVKEQGDSLERTAFKRMRDDMAFARGKQWGKYANSEKYVANLVHRHIRQRVSALYAKNPKAIHEPRPKMYYRIWDEKPDSMLQAAQAVAMAVESDMPPPQEAVMLLQDIQEGQRAKTMTDKIGKTLGLVYQYYLDEQIPPFKQSAKQLIVRAETCGAAYVKLGYQRIMDKRPQTEERIADVSSRIAHLERLSADIADGEVDETGPELEELRVAMQQLQSEEEILVREGLVFDFPRSTAIIFDPDCVFLKGWVGARWVAQEFHFTPERVREIYKVDIGGNFRGYVQTRNGEMIKSSKRNGKENDKARVFEIYDRSTGLVYTACDGYKDWLEEPQAPGVDVEQFFPIYPLTFNDLEEEGEVPIPPSDVELLRHPQQEYNRSREGLRQHRKANAPRYLSSRGALTDDDKINLLSSQPHSVTEVDGLMPGQAADSLVQNMKLAGIDPNMYDTSPIFDDVQKIVGASEANFGSMSGASATEASIGEGARMSTLQSNIDDLDDLLTTLARDGGQVLFQEAAQETVMEIVGPGAVWPDLTREQAAKEVNLKTEAGSSGRPNKAEELANFERVAPVLLQVPGIKPEFLAREAIKRMDDRIEMADAYAEGLPSILGMLKQSQVAPEGAESAPDQQGGEGGDNTAEGPGSAQGPQPGYPAPGDVQP